MQAEDSFKIGDGDAEQAQRADGQKEPVEQQGAGEEAPGVHQGMSKLFQTGGYEEGNEADRRVAPSQNPVSFLELVETG